MKLNAIKQMENYARYNPQVVSLSQGIPFLRSDEHIRESAIDAIRENKVDRYSDPRGFLELRNSISEALLQEKMDYSEKEIIVTAGAIEGLSSVFLSILNPGRNEVIIPTPTYSAYFRTVKVAKGNAIPFIFDEEKGWTLDPEKLEKKITNQTAAILLCNPNNPTGSVYTRETLLRLCDIAIKHNILIVLDEVYKNMIFDDADFYSPAIDKKFKKNIIRVVSFSKDFSLTGWRVGFLHSDKSIIEKILPVHDTLVNCAPVISQYAALAAIKHQDEILVNNMAIYSRHRDIMSGYLKNLNEFLSFTKPKGSYYMFPKIKNVYDTEKFCMDLLTKANLAVVPGSDFGPGGESHIRICFGRAEEDIITGMKSLSKYLHNNL